MVNRYNMEIAGQNTIKVAADEEISELIKLIKPTYPNENCKFLEGYIWATAKRTYNEKLVNRTFHLINHHLYVVKAIGGVTPKHTYLRVSGRGNINVVTREEALDVVNKRVGYVEDSDLMKCPADDSGEIPYNTPTCDW